MLRRVTKSSDTKAILFFFALTLPIIVALKPLECPIGFSLALTKEKSRSICYRLKGPELFEDKFEDCVGNFYTSDLLYKLDISPVKVKLWSDYKTAYPGGPFVDWSFEESTGKLLSTSYNVQHSKQLDIDEELCTIIDTNSWNVTSVSCLEKHYSYCFLSPYEGLNRDGCESDYKRVPEGWPACVQAVTGAGASKGVRATFSQAQEMCLRRKGSLLQRAWRYANHPDLHPGKNTNWTSPLGIVLKKDGLHWLDPDAFGEDQIPEAEWNFEPTALMTPESEIVALSNRSWNLVNESFLFYDVICERQVKVNQPELSMTNTPEGKLMLTVDDETVEEDDLSCFTDSEKFYPTDTDAKRISNTSSFYIKPKSNGYYWCIVDDVIDYKPNESNKALYIRDKTTTVHIYATKIRMKTKYNLENLDSLKKNIRSKLREYVFLRSKYLQTMGDLDGLDQIETEKVLKGFSAQLNSDDRDDIEMKLKRVYLDGLTVLYHVEISKDMFPVTPGTWEDIEVLHMKPVHYCSAFENVPMLPMGESVIIGCKNYKCIGDFNEGVQWIEMETEACEDKMNPNRIVSPNIDFIDIARQQDIDLAAKTITTAMPEIATIDDSDEDDRPWPNIKTTTDDGTELVATGTPDITALPATERPTRPPPVTTIRPTTVTPEQHINDVIQQLENMIADSTQPISEDEINNAADQIDEILEFEDEGLIPGRLLELIDEIVSRADLNGNTFAAVRPNLALMVGDSSPEMPIKGLRVATRNQDQLTADAVELLTEVTENHLDDEFTEVAVNLPQSVANSEHRVTFVIFVNDRAFLRQENASQPRVNSRILSITVSNVTHFDEDETVDIHLKPLQGEVPRDAERTCAYWHFIDAGAGYWSEEGCELFKSPDGQLDTCRCTHLTHFAEILAPRVVFSEKDEKSLEIVGLIGCYFSIAGVLLIILTACLFRTWRKDFSNKIWLQLSIAILFLMLSFLLVVSFRFTRFSISCMAIGVLLHYFVLASFCWMVVSAILSYRRLVIVFSRDASHKLLRACAFAWGLPFAIVGILLAVDPDGYTGQFEEKLTSGTFCYPEGLGFYLTVLAPIILALVVNWSLFILIVRSVFLSQRMPRHGDSGEALRCATVSFLLVFLFGLPWIFGLFSHNIVFAYLFNLTATYQGFILFIFFVIGNKKTRDLWLNKLKIKQKAKIPVTSSTYKSQSSSNKTALPVGVIAAETSYVKPRSLTGSDDMTRFS